MRHLHMLPLRVQPRVRAARAAEEGGEGDEVLHRLGRRVQPLEARGGLGERLGVLLSSHHGQQLVDRLQAARRRGEEARPQSARVGAEEANARARRERAQRTLLCVVPLDGGAEA